MNGTAPISSEGHNYKGEIAKRQWVDAQHLKQGYRLLSESGEWQTVYKVTIQSEKLQAYNLTVDKDHTYFIKGAKTDSQGVWVHNDCWHALPSDAKQVANIDGYKDYQFKDLIELIYVQKRCRKSMQIMINCRMAIIVIN